MEIISNGFLGKKYCNFCDTVKRFLRGIESENLLQDFE